MQSCSVGLTAAEHLICCFFILCSSEFDSAPGTVLLQKHILHLALWATQFHSCTSTIKNKSASHTVALGDMVIYYHENVYFDSLPHIGLLSCCSKYPLKLQMRINPAKKSPVMVLGFCFCLFLIYFLNHHPLCILTSFSYSLFSFPSFICITTALTSFTHSSVYTPYFCPSQWPDCLCTPHSWTYQLLLVSFLIFLCLTITLLFNYIVTSQQEGSWFKFQLTPFCVKFACFPCACVDSLWLLRTIQQHANKLFGDFQSTVGVSVHGCLSLCWSCDRLTTCLGCTLLLTQWQLE